MKEIKKGKLLISTPNILGDLYFNRSIIILTEVKEEEVVGFILNKCLDYTLSDLYKNVKNNKIKVFLASPRGFCAGVDRAIEIVKKSLNKYGSPVYVRHEIVHNKHVVESLKKNFSSYFYPILSKFITVDQIPTTYLILYVICRYFLFFWIYKIWYLLTGSRFKAFGCVMVFILMARVDEFLYRTFSHQEFALAIIFAAIYFFFREQFRGVI